MKFFCRKIIVNQPGLLHTNGPLLLASNHPNSFLDAIILDILFDQPIYSLARGDVFINKTVIRLLTSFKILPVYRISEGAENLQTNYQTFTACKKIFRQNGIVLIFSEGRCINEWHLRPLKKGTARLALTSWDENIPLKVLPVGINYSSFRRFGKNIFINFGEMITHDNIDMSLPEGARIHSFNALLKQQLMALVYEIDASDTAKQKVLLELSTAPWKRWLLFIPAMLGWLAHQPIYLPIKRITWKKTAHNDHYDSFMASLLFLIYPLYLIAGSFTMYWLTNSCWSFSLLLVLPLLAWCYVQVRSAVKN